MKTIQKLLIPVFLLTLFVTYQVSITMFSHVHYVNGVMIVHSHASKDSQHNHTQTQILTIAQVASFMGLEPVETGVEKVFLPVLYQLDFSREIDFISAFYIPQAQLRAPPACF